MNDTERNPKYNTAVGRDALEFIDSFLTPEEISDSNLRVALIGELINSPLVDEFSPNA